MFSDGYAFQNQNATLTNALVNCTLEYQIIEQKYLGVGYTQLEYDSICATIDRRFHLRNINVLADYIIVCYEAHKKGAKYYVEFLDYTYIL